MITSLYVYGTGDRTDGMTYAVAATLEGGRTEQLALFARRTHMELFVNALTELISVPCLMLPSVS